MYSLVDRITARRHSSIHQNRIVQVSQKKNREKGTRIYSRHLVQQPPLFLPPWPGEGEKDPRGARPTFFLVCCKKQLHMSLCHCPPFILLTFIHDQRGSNANLFTYACDRFGADHSYILTDSLLLTGLSNVFVL